MPQQHEDETVIREVAPGVWIFSKPFTRYHILPFGGRSTAVKLADGGVWLLASTPLTDAVRAKIDELGPVRYIVGPDAVHHMFLGEFKKAYPDAKLIGVQEAIDKKTAENLRWDGAWGKDAPGTEYGFESDIQHLYFSGFKNRDVAFFHPATKSLITADLILNLPGTEQYSKSDASGHLPIVDKVFNPWSSVHKKFVSSMNTNKEAMKHDAKYVAAWDFTRIIPCHGDVIEGKGKEAWLAAYSAFLH